MGTASRRDFLRLAGLAGGALVLAACGSETGGLGGPDPGATPQRDRAILNGALTFENTVIAAYGAGLPLLGGASRRLGRDLLEQERQHARRLAGLVRDLGGEPNRPKPADEYRAAFPRLRDQADVLRFATDLENVAISAYVEGVPKLYDPGLRQVAASILANESQHLTAVLGARRPGHPAGTVPEAFVTGRFSP